MPTKKNKIISIIFHLQLTLVWNIFPKEIVGSYVNITQVNMIKCQVDLSNVDIAPAAINTLKLANC